jgi:hypothetical protein
MTYAAGEQALVSTSEELKFGERRAAPRLPFGPELYG